MYKRQSVVNATVESRRRYAEVGDRDGRATSDRQAGSSSGKSHSSGEQNSYMCGWFPKVPYIPGEHHRVLFEFSIFNLQ